MELRIVNLGFKKARDGNITTLVAKKGGVKAGSTELQTRGTSILGEVRNVEKKGLLSNFYVVNLMIF